MSPYLLTDSISSFYTVICTIAFIAVWLILLTHATKTESRKLLNFYQIYWLSGIIYSVLYVLAGESGFKILFVPFLLLYFSPMTGQFFLVDIVASMLFDRGVVIEYGEYTMILLFCLTYITMLLLGFLAKRKLNKH
jgi:hypothetical protein